MDPDFRNAELGTRVRIGLKLVPKNLNSYLFWCLLWLVEWSAGSASITSADL